MADFWIKVEKTTQDKAEIFEISQILDIDPDAVLGKLIRVWCWLDSNSENGHIKSVTHSLIDRLTLTQGFANAMKEVGWLDDNLVPNFDRHLGENAKKRAKDAERKRKSRDSSDKCHKESVTEIGLDKIRVDKSKKELTTPAKPKHNDDDMTCANYILGLVKQNNPTLKADVNKWAVTINQIVRLDKRTHRDICELFLLVSNDVREGFSWSKICRSPAKLRERKDGLQFFDIITDQLKNGGNNAKTGHRQSAAERAEASAERFTDYAKATDF